ncbi:helix-turn-helix domain-containing protein [Rhizobium leguminosarum]|uniref:helix-turn-helix domain-containing protein n=1 Tax=Rhizobium leguminosarum TaxID=384 RepID=UPI001616A196|nr:XRE family transcriptional regulator [Rhizobium leguminosarum]MBB4342112.1 transcriptional regulator with XRE-family HTH domain [Rhizobium leguminosarum]MBB6294736.1 transcriptional regulator with XRE-family HTH domain [Rhizobium leguminosarum]
MYSLTKPPSRKTIEDFVQSDGYGSHMELNQRIFQARTDAKMTQEQLATAVGKTRGAVAQWESGDVRPRHTTLQAIAEATGKPLNWLVNGVDGEVSSPRVGLQVVGEVAAGMWKEGSVRFERTYEPVATHPDYPGYGQRLYRVSGNSINRIAANGEYLHAVELHAGGMQPEHGDLVIVRRLQHGLAEYTAKTLIMEDDRWVLRPESTDPEWQTDIELSGDDDTEIAITDIVIAKWSPIERRRRAPKP